MNIPQAFGKQITARRRDLGLSVKALAALSGVDDNHIGTIERGQAVPRLTTAYVLCDALGVPLWRLLLDADLARDDEQLGVAS